VPQVFNQLEGRALEVLMFEYMCLKMNQYVVHSLRDW